MKNKDKISLIRLDIRKNSLDKAIEFVEKYYGRVVVSKTVRELAEVPQIANSRLIAYLRLDKDVRGNMAIVSSISQYRVTEILKTLSFPLKYSERMYSSLINNEFFVKIDDPKGFEKFHNHSILNYALIGVSHSKNSDDKLEYLNLIDSVPPGAIINAPEVRISPDEILISTSAIPRGGPLWNFSVQHNSIYSSVPIESMSIVDKKNFEEIFGFGPEFLNIKELSIVESRDDFKLMDFAILIDGVPINGKKIEEMADLSLAAISRCASKLTGSIDPKIAWKVWKSEDDDIFIGTQWLRSEDDTYMHFSAKNVITGLSFIVRMMPAEGSSEYTITIERQDNNENNI